MDNKWYNFASVVQQEYEQESNVYSTYPCVIRYFTTIFQFF